jgi:hypothetical protein
MHRYCKYICTPNEGQELEASLTSASMPKTHTMGHHFTQKSVGPLVLSARTSRDPGPSSSSSCAPPIPGWKGMPPMCMKGMPPAPKNIFQSGLKQKKRRSETMASQPPMFALSTLFAYNKLTPRHHQSTSSSPVSVNSSTFTLHRVCYV